jgi:hypothetical protein
LVGGTVGVLASAFHTGPVAKPAQVSLTTSTVAIDDSYVASATGFTPGEGVRFSWTGPTLGVMGDYPADASGRAQVRDPIVEHDPPGDYQIIATGLTSKATASAPLKVTPPAHTPTPRPAPGPSG